MCDLCICSYSKGRETNSLTWTDNNGPCRTCLLTWLVLLSAFGALERNSLLNPSKASFYSVEQTHMLNTPSNEHRFGSLFPIMSCLWAQDNPRSLMWAQRCQGRLHILDTGVSELGCFEEKEAQRERESCPACLQGMDFLV